MAEMLVALAILVAMVGAIVLLRSRFVVVRVTGVSMEPVLREGQRVLVRRVGVGVVQRGDIVVFALASVRMKQPGDPPWMVKRAVAISGDPIPYESISSSSIAERTHVPAGQIVVRGDNPIRSFDSRQAGFIDGSALLGVVVRELRSERGRPV
jgi:signal peptidase I